MAVKQHPVELNTGQRSVMDRVACSYWPKTQERMPLAFRCAWPIEPWMLPLLGNGAVAWRRFATGCTRHRVEEAWKGTVVRRPQAHREACMINGACEAQLVALTCGDLLQG